MLIITSQGDDEIIHKDDIQAFEAVHGLSSQDFVTLNDSSRIPMISESSSEFSIHVMRWLDEFY